MKPMRMLILGGTVFLGRAVTDAALAAGHQLTHFHRAKSAGIDARVETIVGDRTEMPFPASLTGREWDAVIDTSGYLPQVVGRSAHALRDRTGRYLFVSSISVYRDFSLPSIDEGSPVEPPPDPLPETLDLSKYGALKAACESEVESAFGDRGVIVRPGLIVGPGDRTDRFTWWPARIAKGGRVAAPGRPTRPVQFIDVRDLGSWMVRLLEREARGAYNATSPPGAITMGDVLQRCIEVCGADSRIEWIDEAFLASHSVEPWRDMPIWMPEGDPAMRGFMGARVDRATGAGLTFRPLEDTVRGTLQWAAAFEPDHAWKAGLVPERERALLAAWDAAQKPIAR